MLASIELSKYYFHQISSFCCINVLMYYAVLITGGTYRSLVTPLAQDRRRVCGGPACTRLPKYLHYLRRVHCSTSNV